MDKNIIRLFVSSTFNDFKEERDALSDDVFVRIEKYCKDRGYIFQAVDLRWGISETDAINQDTINICLQEVARCQEISSAPNFFIMFGNRFGWQPLPSSILESEFLRFQNILENLPEDWEGNCPYKTFLKWYQLDENFLQPTYLIKKRYQNDNFDADSVFLLKALQFAVFKSDLLDEEKYKYYFSATGLEILKGALELDSSEQENVICYIRDIENIDNHIDTNTDKQSYLKYLRALFKSNFMQYKNIVKISKTIDSKNYIENFKTDTYKTIKKLIDKRILNDSKCSKLNAHEQFELLKTKDFFGRQTALAECLKEIESSNYFVVYGQSGTGKSAFCAKLSLLLKKKYKNTYSYFVGADAYSSDSYHLIKSLVQTLRDKHRLAPISLNNYTDVVNAFRATVFSITDEIVIVIDAINQLVSDIEPLLWVCDELPCNIKVIVVTLPGRQLDNFTKRVHSYKGYELKPLSKKDIDEILDNWQILSNRKLSSVHKELLYSSCYDSGSAIYVRIAFNLSLKWHSFEDVALEKSLSRIIKSYFDSLCSDSHHGKHLTIHTLAYILLGNNGVSESELQKLIYNDPVVLAEIKGRLKNSPSFNKLPFMIWARLYADISSYFKEIYSEGETLFAYYHDTIKNTIIENYIDENLTNYIQKQLIAHYEKEPFYFGNAINRRKITSLPYHYKEIGDKNSLIKLLNNTDYLTCKIKSGKLREIVNELYYICNEVDESIAKALVKTFFLFIIEYNFSSNKKVDIKYIHNQMIYQKKLKLHKMFFEHFNFETISKACPKESEKRILAIVNEGIIYKINGYRRLGIFDVAVSDATNLLKQTTDARRKSTLQYDIAYINYLSDNFAVADKYMDDSIESAKEADALASMQMSKMIKAYFSFISSIFTDRQQQTFKEYDEVLEESLKIFTEHATTDENAVRHISVVWYHRTHIAFYNNDLQGLTIAIENMTENKFFKLTDNTDLLMLMEVRKSILTAKYRLAISTAKKLLALKGRLCDIKYAESIAQIYYMLIYSCIKAGEMQEAQEIYDELLSLAPVCGNYAWLNQIKKMMDTDF